MELYIIVFYNLFYLKIWGFYFKFIEYFDEKLFFRFRVFYCLFFLIKDVKKVNIVFM